MTGILATIVSRMLKKSASFVLDSSKSSTYPRGYACGFDSSAALFGTRRVLARQGWAGETSGLFEHPARGSPIAIDMRTVEPCHTSFSRRLPVVSASSP